MTRNLDRRVEFLVRIDSPRLTEVLAGIIDTCLADTAQARELRPDGTYVRAQGQERRSSQEELAAAARAVVEPAPAAASGLPFTPRRTPERRRKRS
jgi:polyphosphate kinase